MCRATAIPHAIASVILLFEFEFELSEGYNDFTRPDLNMNAKV